VEALLEIFGGIFEAIFEWRKDRAEEGRGAQETVQLGGRADDQPDDQPGGPYSYQLGGRPEQSADGQQGSSMGTSSRRGVRQ
jgi:hypothetical protein